MDPTSKATAIQKDFVRGAKINGCVKQLSQTAIEKEIDFLIRAGKTSLRGVR